MFFRMQFCQPSLNVQSTQVWNSAAEFQTAYQLGAGEGKAAFALLNEVDPRITEKLQNMVM